jgi:hypothetical protein
MKLLKQEKFLRKLLKQENIPEEITEARKNS